MSLLIGNPTANLGITLQKASALEGVALSPGQTISGKVQSVEPDGTVTLVMAGKTVEAVSEVPLAVGQEINLEVVGRIEGRLYLKISGETAAASLVEPELLVNQLAAPSVPITSHSQASLVSTLLENQLPVTEKNLAALSRVASLLGGLGESQETEAAETRAIVSQVSTRPTQDLKLAGFILAAGLKDSPEVWPVLRDYFQQPANLGASLERLVQGLSPGEIAQPAGEILTPPTTAGVILLEPESTVPAGGQGYASQPAAGLEAGSTGTGTVIPGQPAVALPVTEPLIVITLSRPSPEETITPSPTPPADPGVGKETSMGQTTVVVNKSIPTIPSNQTVNQALNQDVNQEPELAQVPAPTTDRAPTQSVQTVPAAGQGLAEPVQVLPNPGPTTAGERVLTQPAGVNPPIDEAMVQTPPVTVPSDAGAAQNPARSAVPAELELYGQLLTELLGTSGQGTSPAGKVLTQMFDLIGMLTQNGQMKDSDEIKGQLREWLSIQKPLTQLLNLVKTEIGKEEVARLILHNKLLELGQAVNTSLQEVVGQQVINTVDKSQPTMPDYYYFSWPLQYQNQESQAELRVYKQKGGNQPLDMNDLYLVFCLQTPNLGTNRFDIHLRGKKMEFRVTVERDGVVDMVQEDWPELASRLKELGFQADLIECRAGTPEQLRPQPEARASIESLRRIDVLV